METVTIPKRLRRSRTAETQVRTSANPCGECDEPNGTVTSLTPSYSVLVKVSKAVPLHAVEALRGRGYIAPTHSRPRHKMGVSGQHHAPAAFYPRGKDPRYSLYRRLGGPQSRSGHRGYRKNPLPLPGIEPRSPGRPARSQTLYCLS
jgi:hypothetical protein